MNYVSTDSRNRNCPNGIVVNMSLGGPYSQAVNDAANGLVRSGYFVAVAAGNSNRDASNFSPASTASVCTVGGTARDDTRYSGSNYGRYVDINGPAVNVVSTVPGGGTVSFIFNTLRLPTLSPNALFQPRLPLPVLPWHLPILLVSLPTLLPVTEFVLARDCAARLSRMLLVIVFATLLPILST